MCGIFGIIANDENFQRKTLINFVEYLAKLSESRGKDSSGFAFRIKEESMIKVLKGPVSVTKLLKTTEYKNLKASLLSKERENKKSNSFAALGHARLVTNGSQLQDVNNQPVVKDGIAGVHNGIIVNGDDLWEKHSELNREFEIDTEVMFALIRKYLNAGQSIIQSVVKANSQLFGTVSTGFMINDLEEFIIYTNNGSLYTLSNHKDIFAFASEKFILDMALKKFPDLFKDNYTLKQVQTNYGFSINYDSLQVEGFDITDSQYEYKSTHCSAFGIDITNYTPYEKQLHAVIDPSKYSSGAIVQSESKLLEYNFDRISNLKRCTNCLLPETFPFIEFDKDGVCNICNNYVKKSQPKPIDEMISLVEPYRSRNGQPDCLVPFSGGRDSTYTLHIVKNILKMNPIAFTYDWGMVTDLGRRNIARVCGKLGVENIIVSANIHWKRENIKKNISAWLKYPALGMIPLFMAGDKFFFYYTNKVKQQNNIKLNIWGINPLENTDFKVGFCGLPLRFNKKRIYSISVADQMKLFGYVGKNILKSPGYINQSIFDTLGSFASRYVTKKEDYYHLFDYYGWDEDEIEDLILNEYNWETAIDTKTTWRIGDGTAGFYNYIYYTVAGFSEYDTFRSNQIREGMLNRKKGLELVNEENRPRYESIKWYLDIVGLDFENTIKRINNIPKLY